jgi:predicted Zn-dependent protease
MPPIPLVQDAALIAYIQEVGMRLARNAPRQDVEYQFFVADFPEPNAYAGFGGLVFVTRGLLAFTNSEDELANVIGHEIGHVAARHAAQRQAQASGLELANRMLGTAIAGIAGGGAAGNAAGQAGQVAGTGLGAAYSRDQERESDEIGQQLAARSGWDPQGMARFLATLEQEAALQRAESPRPAYLASHPTLGERVQASTDRAATLERAPPAAVAPKLRDYYRLLDGLMVGPDPALGVFRGQRFLHADLDFRIDFPAGWRLLNTPDAVVGMAPGRDAVLGVELQPGSKDPATAAAEFARASRLTLKDQADTTIGPWPATRAVATAATPAGPIAIDLAWIAHPRGTLRIIGLAPGPRLETYRQAFTASRDSLRPLDREDRRQVVGYQLRITKGFGGESMQEFSTRTRNRWTPEVTAIANGVPPGTRLTGDRLMKYVVEVPYRGSGKR